MAFSSQILCSSGLGVISIFPLLLICSLACATLDRDVQSKCTSKAFYRLCVCLILWVPAELVCHSIAGRGPTSNNYFAQGHCMILRVSACFLWISGLLNELKDTSQPATICFFRDSGGGKAWPRVFLELWEEEKGRDGMGLFVNTIITASANGFLTKSQFG